MTEYTLKHDMELLYITAASFPDGVMAAHEQLQAVLQFTTERKYYGISFPGADGNIMYKAAAEKMHEGEEMESGLEIFLLKKGLYASILVQDYMNHIPAIGEAFQTLLKHPKLDPGGACVEWYINEADVQCMVRLI